MVSLTACIFSIMHEHDVNSTAASVSTTTTTSTTIDGSDTSNPNPPSVDLSVLAARSSYIDANLTQILDSTPKPFTYLDDDLPSLPLTSTTLTRLLSRIDSLKRENRHWVDQYHSACTQLQSHKSYLTSLSSSPPPHPHDALFQSLLSENRVLLDRYDSVARRCHVQEQMIESRDQALKEFQAAWLSQREVGRVRGRKGKAVVEKEGEGGGEEMGHTRHSSTASNASELVESIDAILTRPPRLFLSSTSSSRHVSSPSTPRHVEEETKQPYNDRSNSSTPPSSSVIAPLPSKPTVLQRRLRTNLTVSAKPATARPVRTPPSPSSRSPAPRSATSALSSSPSPPSRLRSSSATSASRPPLPPTRPRSPLPSVAQVPRSPRSPAPALSRVLEETEASKARGRANSLTKEGGEGGRLSPAPLSGRVSPAPASGGKTRPRSATATTSQAARVGKEEKSPTVKKK